MKYSKFTGILNKLPKHHEAREKTAQVLRKHRRSPKSFTTRYERWTFHFGIVTGIEECLFTNNELCSLIVKKLNGKSPV